MALLPDADNRAPNVTYPPAAGLPLPPEALPRSQGVVQRKLGGIVLETLYFKSGCGGIHSRADLGSTWSLDTICRDGCRPSRVDGSSSASGVRSDPNRPCSSVGSSSLPRTSWQWRQRAS